MLIPTIIMGALAIVLVLIGCFRGEGEHVVGIKSAVGILIDILPLLIFAFIVAGMIQALIPKEFISKWIGGESGWRGIFIGTIAGGFSPGGPYVAMPLAAGFLRAGAGVGTLVAYLTAWSLLGFSRLPIEIGVLGWRFALIRLSCTFFFPPIAGLLAHIIFSGFKWS